MSNSTLTASRLEQPARKKQRQRCIRRLNVSSTWSIPPWELDHARIVTPRKPQHYQQGCTTTLTDFIAKEAICLKRGEKRGTNKIYKLWICNPNLIVSRAATATDKPYLCQVLRVWWKTTMFFRINAKKGLQHRELEHGCKQGSNSGGIHLHNQCYGNTKMASKPILQNH